MTGVKAAVEENKWYLEVLFPEEYLKEICDFEEIKKGRSFYCNFYKISESEEILHFGSYSPIESEKPDFHLLCRGSDGITTPLEEYKQPWF